MQVAVSSLIAASVYSLTKQSREAAKEEEAKRTRRLNEAQELANAARGKF